ncbi:MAG TPA: aconitate hydratase, partial [Anaerolineae bacterium]|nr:aconitate hydratase [Anaerolineae bacterium]
DIDLETEPLAVDPNGNPVFLRDVWPTEEEIRQEIRRSLRPAQFRRQYATVSTGNETWNAIPVPEGDLYAWDPGSTYIHEPPFFVGLSPEPAPFSDILGARVLALLGDSVTTDHISPAGAIPTDSPAGRYLIGQGVAPADFNSFGSRRGNHEVMVRGTFGNIRIKNLLLPGTEGGVTLHLPSGERMSIYDAAMQYRGENTPLLIVAGKEYGTGSSRDWAAKGTLLLGVRAVLAESYERIHRSNLIGMGVLPLQFLPGESASSLRLTGREVFDVEGLVDLQPGGQVTVRAGTEGGQETVFRVLARVDSPVEVEYLRNGGILHTVLRNMLRAGQA